MLEANVPNLPPARQRYSRLARSRRFGWSAFLMLSAGVFVALVVVAERAPPSPRETPQQRRNAEVAFLVLAGLCVAGAAVSGLRVRGERAVEAIASEHALTYRRPAPSGARTEDVVVSWDAVESFTEDVRVLDYHGIPLRTIHRYTIRAADGLTVTLDDAIAAVPQLAARVAAETLRHMLPRMRTAIARGATVAFGPIALAREGISYDGRLLPWDQVGGIERDRYGEIVVRERNGGGRWARVAVSQVPNAHVLLPLVRELGEASEA